MFKIVTQYDIEKMDTRLAVVLQGPVPVAWEGLVEKDLGIDIDHGELEKFAQFLNHIFANCLMANAEQNRKNTPEFELPSIERV